MYFFQPWQKGCSILVTLKCISFLLCGKKGATFGVKRTQKVSDTPGPGQYTNADVISMVKSKGASVRIGQTKRADNFASKTIDLPGPGNY